MKPVSACPTATEWGDSLSGNVEPGLSPEPCNNAPTGSSPSGFAGSCACCRMGRWWMGGMCSARPA